MRLAFWLGVILMAAVGCGSPGVRNAHDAEGELKRLAKSGALVIDVRTPAEFESGHVRGATNVPVDQIERRITSVAPDKNSPILLHCRSGRRSALAKASLEQMGYTRVHDLGSLEHARNVVE